MQQIVTDRFLALIENEKPVSFNENEQEILKLYNHYNVENSDDFYYLIGFLSELRSRNEKGKEFLTAQKNLLTYINRLCKERNLEPYS